MRPFRVRAAFEDVVERVCFLTTRVKESDNDTDMLAVCGMPPATHHLALQVPEELTPPFKILDHFNGGVSKEILSAVL